MLTSQIKEYKLDNPKILEKCFQADWENTKIPKFLKSEEETAAMKEVIQKNYIYFHDSYKFLSGVDPQKDLVCIGTNTLSDVM